MSELAFWRIDPHTQEGTPTEQVAADKPVLFFLSGSGNYVSNESNLALNKAVYSFLPNIPADRFELYIPTMTGAMDENINILEHELKYNIKNGRADEMAEFFLPEVPKNFEELRQRLSQLTIVGYSFGCRESLALKNALAKRIKEQSVLSKEQINNAMHSLAIVNIGKELARDLPDYAPVPTYTVVMTKDKHAFPGKTADWIEDQTVIKNLRWAGAADISHAFKDNHLVVEDSTEINPKVRGIKLTQQGEAADFASRVANKPRSDETWQPEWKLNDVGEQKKDNHHIYLYTNTHANFVPDKATQTFLSTASAPVTVGIIQKFMQASLDATAHEARNGGSILAQIEKEELSAAFKEKLSRHFTESKKEYERFCNELKGFETTRTFPPR